MLWRGGAVQNSIAEISQDSVGRGGEKILFWRALLSVLREQCI